MSEAGDDVGEGGGGCSIAAAETATCAFIRGAHTMRWGQSNDEADSIKSVSMRSVDSLRFDTALLAAQHLGGVTMQRAVVK